MSLHEDCYPGLDKREQTRSDLFLRTIVRLGLGSLLVTTSINIGGQCILIMAKLMINESFFLRSDIYSYFLF